jgi:Domain of unknown function (DUF6378)
MTDSGRPASLAGEMLTAAAAIVDGARGHVNGEAERSFTAIAAMWTAYLQSRCEPGDPVRPRDVPQMMALLKQQRAEWGIPERDHYVDGAGYFALSGEIALS